MRGANIFVVLNFTLSPAIADSYSRQHELHSNAYAPVVEHADDDLSLAVRLTEKNRSAKFGAIKIELPKAKVASLGNLDASVLLRCNDSRQTEKRTEEIINLTEGCSSLSVYTTRPIEIEIPYSDRGMEEEIDETAIKVFRAETQTASLGAIQPLDTFVDLANKRTVATLDQQSGNYVVGVLKALEGPDRAAPSFDGQSLNGMLQANPLVGVPLTAKPEPNAVGEARLAYPLELPGTRGDFRPSISINYVSKSGYGALGEGWHLNVRRWCTEAALGRFGSLMGPAMSAWPGSGRTSGVRTASCG